MLRVSLLYFVTLIIIISSSITLGKYLCIFINITISRGLYITRKKVALSNIYTTKCHHVKPNDTRHQSKNKTEPKSKRKLSNKNNVTFRLKEK